MRPKKPVVPPGFRAPPKPKQKPISQMTARELHDQHDRNARLLNSSYVDFRPQVICNKGSLHGSTTDIVRPNFRSACTSALAERLSSEQAAIESRLLELEGVEAIRRGLKKTDINADEIMNVDQPQVPRVIDAKQRALSRYVCATASMFDRLKLTGMLQAPMAPNGAQHVGSITLQEAIELEQRAHVQDAARQQRLDERNRRIGLPVRGEVLSRAEMDARMWAFM